MTLAHDFDAIIELSDAPIEQCRVCGCTDDDCTGCIETTGSACGWAEPGLCTACA